MSFTESLAEIINHARKLEDVDAKASYLRSKSSSALQDILLLMCDSSFTFCLPETAPPYKPSEHSEVHGLLYREVRKFKYFVEQMPESKKVNKIKRESIFIQMLENIDPEDAKLVLRMVAKQPYPELSPAVVNKAFPGLIDNPVEVKRGRGRPKKSEAV
jgi:hypothetical protein